MTFISVLISTMLRITGPDWGDPGWPTTKAAPSTGEQGSAEVVRSSQPDYGVK